MPVDVNVNIGGTEPDTIDVTVNIGTTELELQVVPGIRDIFLQGNSGDVLGPASSVNDNLVKFSGTTGKQLADSGFSSAAVQSTINHVSATTGAHGMTALGASIVAATTATAVRDIINLGTASTPSFDEITVDTVNFDLTAAETVINEGELTWDNEEKTLYLGLANSAHIHVGQEVIYYAENATTSAIQKGTLVAFAGTVGTSGKLRVTPWTGAQQPNTVLGITSSTFAAGVGNAGVVVHFGKIRGFSTTGTAPETWVAGDVLYAKSSGGLTNIRPTTAPIITVATITNAHSNNGSVRVRVDIGQVAADTGAASVNHNHTTNQINLTTDVTGVLPTTQGGTGQTALSSVNANTLGSSGATVGQVLTANGTGGTSWASTTGGAGIGDVTGPSVSVDNHVALFSGTTGKIIKSSGSLLGDAAAKNTGTTAGTVAAGDHNHTANQINLTTAVTGTLPVANGGTGQTALSSVLVTAFATGPAATAGQVLTASGTGTASFANPTGGGGSSTVRGQLGVTFDGGGVGILNGATGFLRVPYNCTITGGDIVSSVSGSFGISIRRDTFANFPPDAADEIASVNLSNNVKTTFGTTNFSSTSLTEGQYLAFTTSGSASLTYVVLTLIVTRST